MAEQRLVQIGQIPGRQGLSSCALAQHSFTPTKNFSFRARPAPAASSTRPAANSTRTRPAPTRKAVRVPASAPQMGIPATHAGKPAPSRTLIGKFLLHKKAVNVFKQHKNIRH